PPPVWIGMPSATEISRPRASARKHEKSWDWLKIGLREARRMMIPISRAMLSSLRSRTVSVTLSSSIGGLLVSGAGETVVAVAIHADLSPRRPHERGRRLLDDGRAGDPVAAVERAAIEDARGDGGVTVEPHRSCH